jgi:hypothetical protein
MIGDSEVGDAFRSQCEGCSDASTTAVLIHTVQLYHFHVYTRVSRPLHLVPLRQNSTFHAVERVKPGRMVAL